MRRFSTTDRSTRDRARRLVEPPVKAARKSRMIRLGMLRRFERARNVMNLSRREFEIPAGDRVESRDFHFLRIILAKAAVGANNA